LINIIFLDIDGVLNSMQFMIKSGKDYGRQAIDPDAVSYLNQIIQQTNAKVVISSSWRIIHRLSEIKDILYSRGFIGDIIDETPILRSNNRIRGDEIQLWLDNNKVDNFVIIDDDSDMGDLKDRLVQTSFKYGLCEEHVEKCVNLLKE
jgi:hypothetical protein